MERLFSPCNRFYDILESEGRLEELIQNDPEPLQELNLNVSTEELLSAERAFKYADLDALLGNGDTVAWLTPHATVSRDYGRAVDAWLHLDIELCSFNFNADGEDTYAFARSTEHLLEIVDVVLRLLAVSVVHSVSLHNWSYLEGTSINAPTLAYLMEQCQSLKLLSLQRLEMDENHCRMLGDFSRPDLEIVLDGCRVTSAGSSALAEVLGRNQGPNKLCSCFEIDNVVLADGLRGNSRLKSLTARFFQQR
jgi:hypothetical protein